MKNSHLRKMVILGLMIIFLLFLGTSCKEKVEHRNMDVSYNKLPIESIAVTGRNFSVCAKVTNCNHESCFSKYFKDHGTQLMEVKLGEKITLNFGKDDPDELVIKEWLLDAEGNVRYSDKEVRNLEYYDVGNGSYHFVADKNMFALLSSDSKDQKGKYRGIRVVAVWGCESQTYVFAHKVL